MSKKYNRIENLQLMDPENHWRIELQYECYFNLELRRRLYQQNLKNNKELKIIDVGI